jgi:hypothetical protein
MPFGNYARTAATGLGRTLAGKYGAAAQGALTGGIMGGIIESLPGEGSTLGGMARGAAYGAGMMSLGKLARSQAGQGVGMTLGKSLAGGGYGGALFGGTIGGLYGMFSGDETMYGGGLKGAAMGFGLGAAGAMGARYARAGRRMGTFMRGDLKNVHSWGSSMYSNMGNRIRSTLKNWS